MCGYFNNRASRKWQCSGLVEGFLEKADEFGNSAIAQLVEFDCKKRRWKEVEIKWFDGERVVYTENQMPSYWWEVTPQIFHGYRRLSLVCFGSNP